MKYCKLIKIPTRVAIATVILFLTLCTPFLSSAVTPEDFGFGALKVGGKPIIGSVPLLVVVYELSTNGASPDGSFRQPLAANFTSSIDKLVFDFLSFPSVNGYYLENSHAAFYWQRAGVIGPVELDANETATLYAQASDDTGSGTKVTALDSAAGFNYLLGLVAAKTQYNFAQWDSNGDGSITQDELSILVIGNNSHANGDGTSNSRAGANRPIGKTLTSCVIPGQNVTIRGKVASLDNKASFLTITHELSHSLGTVDLYGTNCFSAGLTLMTCSIVPVNDDRRTYHLDPWHKMRLGWLRPRIETLATGGIATVAAAQITSADTPVLLYDPARGINEYFIVEFRSNRISTGVDHDANVTDPSPSNAAATGMALWHVNLGFPANMAYHEGSPNNQAGGSQLWTGITPLLRWSDGTPTATRLNPGAIINNGRELVFEWLTSSDTWVDFLYNGTEAGTFAQPFNTLTKGVNAASRGGTVKFKTSGKSAETLAILKPLDLQALGGPVTIGQ